MIKKLTIFGVGLIGGSLALALKKAGVVEEIVGCSRDEGHLKQAVDLGVIDDYKLDPVLAAEHANMIFLSVPMRAMETVMQSFKSAVGPDTIITDGGSSKASIVAAAKNVFGEVPSNLVPGHPIAGREKSGVSAAIDNLYVDHKVILTPLAHTELSAVQRVKEMWETVGAHVETLEVEQHDRVLAATSHLPHVVAYAMVDTLSKTNFVDEIFHYAAGGFRDLSRIASSDPTMWRDICLENKTAILEMVDAYQRTLDTIKTQIETDDADGLYEIFSHAKKTRDSHVHLGDSESH